MEHHPQRIVPWYVADSDSSDDPNFFRSESAHGKVHVHKGYWLPNWLYPDEESRTTAVIAGLHYFEGMCGLKVRYCNGYGLSAFPDDDLCGRCVKRTPEELRNRLFEHPTSYDE